MRSRGRVGLKKQQKGAFVLSTHFLTAIYPVIVACQGDAKNLKAAAAECDMQAVEHTVFMDRIFFLHFKIWKVSHQA